jgi:hypothetical protein
MFSQALFVAPWIRISRDQFSKVGSCVSGDRLALHRSHEKKQEVSKDLLLVTGRIEWLRPGYIVVWNACLPAQPVAMLARRTPAATKIGEDGYCNRLPVFADKFFGAAE